MPIDPSIALGFKMPQIQDPTVAAARAQEFGVNALKMQEMQRGLQEEQEIRNYLAGADLAKPETRAGLAKFGKAGLATGTLLAQQEKAGLETKKLTGEISVQELKKERERISDLAFNPSNENIIAHLQDSVLRKQMTPDQANAMLAQVSNMSTDQRKQVLLQMGTDASKRLDQMTISATQQQTADISRRGQDISAATQRRGQDMARIPTGYRMTPEGALEPMPGGPTTTPISPKEMQVREAKFPQATSALKSFDAKSDELIRDLDRLSKHPGLNSITGVVYGRTPSLTAVGREAQALYDKITAGLQFKELQDMRNASPTGGALGNVSNQEGLFLRQAAGALDRTQEPGSVQAELGRIVNSVRNSKQRLREAYDMTYDYKGLGGDTAPTPPSPPAPSAGGNSVTIPSGKVLTFPTPEAAADYKKAAGL